MSLLGHARNRLCYCGSSLKYKKCCLPKAQGFTKTETGWQHIHKPDLTARCNSCFQLAKDEVKEERTKELYHEVMEIVSKEENYGKNAA